LELKSRDKSRNVILLLVISIILVFSSVRNTSYIFAKVQVANQSLFDFGNPTNSSNLRSLKQNATLESVLASIEKNELQKNLKLKVLQEIYNMRNEQMENNFITSQKVGQKWYEVLGGLVNGTRSYGSGNYTGAIKYYDKALAIDPHYAVVLNNKGLAFYRLGNYTGAIKYYDKALAIDPHYVLGLNNKGLALYALGNYTGAIKYYDKVLAIDPNFASTWNNKGNALAKLGRYGEAAASYNKALESSKRDQYLQNVTPIFSKWDRYTKSSYNVSKDYFRIFEVVDIITNQQASVNVYSNEVSLTNQGISFKLMNPPNYILAKIYFKKALGLDYSHPFFYAVWNMADTLAKVGDDTGANIYWQQAVNINATLTSTYHGELINTPTIDPGPCTLGFFRCMAQQSSP
jgi:Flp pilus assembly protein TadD